MLELIRLQIEDKISYSHAKIVLFEIIDGDVRAPIEIASENGWIKDSTTIDFVSINQIIDQVLAENPVTVEKIQKLGVVKKKKKSVKKGGPIKFLVGECMKSLKAQGDPEYIQKYIIKKL